MDVQDSRLKISNWSTRVPSALLFVIYEQTFNHYVELLVKNLNQTIKDAPEPFASKAALQAH